MNKLPYIVILILVFACTKNSEVVNANGITKTSFLGEVDWVQSFGGSNEDTARAIITTTDGGFAILGFSNSTDGDLQGKTTDVNDYWLLKIDADGAMQWSKTYGGSKDDRGQGLVQTQDGGYALTGYAQSSDGDGSVNNGFHDNWILKLDAAGTIEWEKSFGFSGHDHSYDILETADGDLFFTGFLDISSAIADGNTEKSNSTTRHGVGEFWGTKIDNKGNIQWRGYYGGTNNDRAHAVVRSDDGGYVMAGFTESTDFDITDARGSYDFWVVKIGDDGNLVWEGSFGGSGIDQAQDISETADGGFVITGNTFSNDIDVSNNNGASDIWLIKIDANGEKVWDENYGGSQFDDAQSLILAKDGGFFITGNSKSIDIDVNANAGENDILIIKTDAEGRLEWQKTIGGSGLDFGYDVVEIEDGSIVLVGETASEDFEGVENRGKSDAVIIKIK